MTFTKNLLKFRIFHKSTVSQISYIYSLNIKCDADVTSIENIGSQPISIHIQMNFENKNILIVSPESWNDHHVSKHHYARTLTKLGNIVYFLSPSSRKTSIEEIEPNLFIIDFKNHTSGLRWLPRLIQTSNICKDFVELEKYAQTSFDVIWNFDSSRFYELSAIDSSVLKICHLVDLNQNFQRKSLASSANLCLCNSEPIFTELKKHNTQTFKINHGISLPEKNQRPEVVLPGSNEIKAIYTGNLDIEYLDNELILNLGKGHTEVDFIFIGGYSSDNILKNARLKNFHFVGRKQPEELHEYYKNADILLVTYLANEYKDQLANPHKILEYLASGKVVLATKTLEYEGNSIIEMASTHEDFMMLFKKILSNLKDFNSVDKMQARKDFAQMNTYEKQIERINKLIESI